MTSRFVGNSTGPDVTAEAVFDQNVGQLIVNDPVYRITAVYFTDAESDSFRDLTTTEIVLSVGHHGRTSPALLIYPAQQNLTTAASVIVNPESSTTRSPGARAIEKATRDFFAIISREELEELEFSYFASRVASLLLAYGVEAVMEIANLIEGDDLDPEIGSWTLRALGRISDRRSYFARRWILERQLRSKHAIVRDGAALGLVSLRDRHATPFLRAAVDREKNRRLKQDLEKALRKVERVG